MDGGGGLHHHEMSETSETSELPEPKFRKTKSEKWAVMAPMETLEAALSGDGKVKVLKKSGDHSSFTVGSLGKPFDVDGISMCYGYAPGDEDPGSGGGSGQPPTARPSTAPQRSSRPDSQEPPQSSSTASPPRDDSEPLPEYQGEDHWGDGF